MNEFSNDFIPRKFRNETSDKIVDFEDIVKIHNKLTIDGTDDKILHQLTIAIILGEPASGKTCQLKEFDKQNQNAYFVEMINIEDEDIISDNTEIVLLDSIDEALTDYKNPKKIQSKLTRYIQKCQEKNPSVRFAISCRYLEWNEYFREELEKIDKELEIYAIEPLSKETINQLLKRKNIDDVEFWKFIEDNYLQPLLENIMIVLHIINNFKNYKDQKINYVDIYHEIIKEHITIKGSDREEVDYNKSLEELLLIVSSLATYMLLNRKKVTDENLIRLADELYQINDKSILADDLKIILNTSLFKKEGNQYAFYHKSIQEFLVAQFIKYKNLDLETINSIFAHEMCFYEELEEVIIYLTNIEPRLFDKLIEFDPFIFRRHPLLNVKQQEQLLIAMTNRLSKQEQTAWDKWKYLYDSTLVKFDKIIDVESLIRNVINIKDINYPLYVYFFHILKNNYSEKMENLIFEILDNIKSDKKEFRRYVSHQKIPRYDFNNRLYEYMKEHNLLQIDTYFMPSIEQHMFKVLYGSKELLDIEKLLLFIDSHRLKYTVSIISSEDAYNLFLMIQKNYQKDIYHDERISWMLYALLKNYKYCRTDTLLIDIVSFLCKQHIFIDFKEDKSEKDTLLDFNDIADDFWSLFFKENGFEKDYFYTLKRFLSYYNIDIKHLEKAIEKYPIKDYIERYIYTRISIPEADTVLMKDISFKTHMELLWAEHTEEEKQRREDDKKEDWYKRKEKIKIEYLDKINSFSTVDDLYSLFKYAVHRYGGEFDERFCKDLDDKYQRFIQLSKDAFRQDDSFLELKKNIQSKSVSNIPTFLFEYLFRKLSTEEIIELVNTKDEYKKLFWHLYVYKGLNERYFIELSKRYQDSFLELVVEVVQLSSINSKKPTFGITYEIVRIFDELDIVSKEHLSTLIEELSLPIDEFIAIEDKKCALEIIALDKTQYEFILKTMVRSIEVYIDKEQLDEYLLKALAYINPNKAIKDYCKYIYNNGERYKKFSSKKLLENRLKKQDVNKYENILVNSTKIERYIYMVNALYRKFSNPNPYLKQKIKHPFEKLDAEYLKMILTDYYEFFKEDKRPLDGGVCSPNQYDNLYDIINFLWQSLELSTKHLELLKELSNSNNKRLATRAKYTLKKLYDLQAKERSFPNSHYKKIFNKEKEVKQGNETHIHGDVYGTVNNNGEVNQTINHKQNEVVKNDEIWYQKWWFISLIIGLVGGGLTWWQFNIWWGIGISSLLFLTMIMFDPKRRFFRIGLSSLFLGGLQFLPYKFDLIIPKNEFIYGYLKSGDTSIPWFGVLLILLSGFLFWLDSKKS